MNVLEAALVEDSGEQKEILQQYLKRYEEEKGVFFHLTYYPNGESFLADYGRIPFSLVFLDIDLGKGHPNGMEIAKRLREIDSHVLLLFITNLRQYVTEGYEVDALNYILKPVNYYSLSMTLDKAVKALSYEADQEILIHSKGSIRKIDLNTLFYVDIVRHEIVFHTEKEDIPSYGTLKPIESLLLAKGFFKVSNYALVNLKFVKKIDGFTIVMQDGKTLFLSRRRKKEFLEALIARFGEVI